MFIQFGGGVEGHASWSMKADTTGSPLRHPQRANAAKPVSIPARQKFGDAQDSRERPATI